MKNQPAFPILWDTEGSQSPHQTGLTKREYYAGLALQGLLAHDGNGHTENRTRPEAAKRNAELAIMNADALLLALEAK